MKVLLVNGSPKANGNTARALAEVAEQLHAEGIDTEVFQLGAKPIRDCIGCGQCGKLDCRCTFDDDVVNELIAAAEQADGFVFGSPSPAAAARRPRSMCSTSTSPLSKCPWLLPPTGITCLAACPATPMGMPRALPPCETSAKTWPGSCAASRQDRPPASTHPRQIEQRPTSFDRAAGP